MCNMLRQSISSQVMQTLASLLLHYDQIPTAHLALTHTFIYWRESNGFVAVFNYFVRISLSGARGRVVGWGTALQAGRSRFRSPMVSVGFFIDTVLPAALCQPLREMITRNISWGCRRPVCSADNLLSWNLGAQPPRTLRARPGIYRNFFTITFTFGIPHAKRKGNGKEIPVNAWTCPEGSRKLSSPWNWWG
jgi:hypothetical protein